jgi:hypothetical protein
MKTHFPNLRKLLMVSAIGTPILMLQMVLFYLGGSPDWALVFCFLNILLSLALPFYTIAKSAEVRPKDNLHLLSRALQILSVFLLVAWLRLMPEVRDVMAQLYESGAFMDWRFVTALALWACYACLANWRTMRALDDRTIYEYYAAKDRLAQPR